jgi:hypothetical protein
MLRSIDLPMALTEIGNDAFEQCAALREVKIPTAVQVIGSDAFAECLLLSKVELSTGLRKIGGSAFSKCPSLRDVILNSPAPPAISKSTFKGVVANFWVPKGCTMLYAASKDWVKIAVREKQQ